MRALGARCCCHPHCRPYHWHSTLPGGILRAGPLTCAANREASAPPNVLVKCMETRHERGTRRGTFRFSLGSALISTLSRTGCVLACWLCRTRGATELPSCAVRSAQRTAALPSFEAAVTEPALRAHPRWASSAVGATRPTQQGRYAPPSAATLRLHRAAPFALHSLPAAARAAHASAGSRTRLPREASQAHPSTRATCGRERRAGDALHRARKRRQRPMRRVDALHRARKRRQSPMRRVAMCCPSGAGLGMLPGEGHTF